MSEMNRGKQAVSRGADRTTDILDEVKNRFSDVVEDVKDKGDELLSDAKERGMKAWGNAQGQGEDAWKGFQSLVRKHPGPFVGAAFVAGALFYALMGNKED